MNNQMKRVVISIITLSLLIGSLKAGGPPAIIPSPTAANKTPKLIWNCDLQAGSGLAIYSVETIQQKNAPFSFELTLDNRGMRVLQISVTSSRSIVDEAAELDVFLDAIGAKGIDVSSISRVMDCVDEVEVKSRVQKE